MVFDPMNAEFVLITHLQGLGLDPWESYSHPNIWQQNQKWDSWGLQWDSSDLVWEMLWIEWIGFPGFLSSCECLAPSGKAPGRPGRKTQFSFHWFLNAKIRIFQKGAFLIGGDHPCWSRGRDQPKLDTTVHPEQLMVVDLVACCAAAAVPFGSRSRELLSPCFDPMPMPSPRLPEMGHERVFQETWGNAYTGDQLDMHMWPRAYYVYM